MVHHLFLLGFNLLSLLIITIAVTFTLFQLLNHLISTHKIDLFHSPPHALSRKVSEPLHGTQVLPGVKPQDLKLRKKFPKYPAAQVQHL